MGDFYSTSHTSGALRRYGGRSAGHGGAAVGYEHNRALGDLHVPRPGAPEIVSGYESPEPGAATVHLGSYMPEGAARNYGQQMLGVEAPAPAKMDLGLIRKAAALAAGYHGVKRNNGSIFWGVIWAAAAFISPFQGVLVPLFGAAQGFGQARPKSNPARRRSKTSKKRLGLYRRNPARRKSTKARKMKRPRFTKAKTRRMTRRGVGAYSLHR